MSINDEFLNEKISSLLMDNLDSITFVGQTLGPLFLYDPADKQAEALYESLQELDAAEAAKEWPFVDSSLAKEALLKITTSIKDQDKVDGVNSDAMPGEDLIWEYRRLFVGPNRKAAPLWGSVYTDRECVIFGESTLELRKWMRQVGVQCKTKDGEPEDHIGSMLLMMAWLAQNKPETLEEFLAQHLLTWAPHFLDILEQETENDFYRGLAQLTKASLQGIQETLNLEVVIPRFYR